MDRKNALKRITQGLTGLTLAALAPAATAAPAPAKPQNIVVHLSNSEGENALHAAMMGIGLGTSLRQRGAKVTLMLDASGPNLAKTAWSGKGLASAPASAPASAAMPPMSLGAVLASFVKAGGIIRLCPHCSRMCGVMPGNVVPGAQIAGEGELAQIVFDADKILDY